MNDLSLMRNVNFEDSRQKMYQSVNYQDRRRDKITLVLDIQDTTTVQHLNNGTEFRVNLTEPLLVDRLSNIFLDNFMTFNCVLSNTSNNMAFVVTLNEFNNQSIGGTTDVDIDGNPNINIHNKLIIPNENNDLDNFDSVVVHKGKKMNYVTTINPCKISSISGKITNLSGNGIFSSNALIIELETELPTVEIPAGSIVADTTFGNGATTKTTAHVFGITMAAIGVGGTTLFLLVAGAGGELSAPTSGSVTELHFHSPGAGTAILTDAGALLGTLCKTSDDPSTAELSSARAILEFLIEVKE